MCIALIGGMDRLRSDYESEAQKHGVDLRVFTKSITGLSKRLKSVDAVVVFTGKTSHRLTNEAKDAARQRSIPVMMIHSCGVCSLRECLGRLACNKPHRAPCCGACTTGKAPGRPRSGGTPE